MLKLDTASPLTFLTWNGISSRPGKRLMLVKHAAKNQEETE